MVKIDDFVKANLAFFHHPRRIPILITGVKMQEEKSITQSPSKQAAKTHSKSETWSCGPPARRSYGSESQVRDDRLCHRSNLFMVSGVRFQVSVKIES